MIRYSYTGDFDVLSFNFGHYSSVQSNFISASILQMAQFQLPLVQSNFISASILQMAQFQLSSIQSKLTGASILQMAQFQLSSIQSNFISASILQMAQFQFSSVQFKLKGASFLATYTCRWYLEGTFPSCDIFQIFLIFIEDLQQFPGTWRVLLSCTLLEHILVVYNRHKTDHMNVRCTLIGTGTRENPIAYIQISYEAKNGCSKSLLHCVLSFGDTWRSRR